MEPDWKNKLRYEDLFAEMEYSPESRANRLLNRQGIPLSGPAGGRVPIPPGLANGPKIQPEGFRYRAGLTTPGGFDRAPTEEVAREAPEMVGNPYEIIRRMQSSAGYPGKPTEEVTPFMRESALLDAEDLSEFVKGRRRYKGLSEGR